ncbi:vWA domain-containing protein [Cytobacillus purgationiresistens]|nr:BatA and WFA domain-containing protein [Cytobacillus purgationiresistens]
MQFLNPYFFFFGIFIAAVILFYFFRKQYKEQSVASNMLWQQVLNEWQASPWLKKLQQNLIFWLQILALLLLMLALVRPFFMGQQIKGEHLIFIVDTSASMAAVDDGDTRFDKAKAMMGELIKKTNGQPVTLIQAGDKPSILLNQEADKAIINEKIQSLELTYNHENIAKTLNLAASLADNRDTAIHIFSDAVKKKEVAEILDDQYAEVHNIGGEIQNISLQSFGVAPIEGKIAGVAVIANQTDAEKKAILSVRTENNEWFKEEVSIPSNDQVIVNIADLPKETYYEAVLDANDGYQVDNAAIAIYSENNPSVYALNKINPFTIKGFQIIGTDIIQVKEKRDNMNGIMIAEGESLQDLPMQPAIFFRTNGEKQKITEQLITKDEQLLQYVDAKNIYIDSVVTSSEGNLEPVLMSGDVPVIQKGMNNGYPIIVINFSLTDSDWPLQPGFPIFLYNAYQYLSQTNEFLGYFSANEERWISMGEGEDAQIVEIFNQADENLYSLNLAEESFTAPATPGIYQAVIDERIYYFSVLLDEREKHASLEDAFTINEKSLSEVGVQRPVGHIWYWLTFIALCLCFVEWEVYRRGHRI